MEKTEIQGQVMECHIASEQVIASKCLWEQRRYELAKEIFLRRITNYTLTTIDDDLKQSVEWADRLIAELQKGK